MAREVGKVQPQASTRRIISNQSSNDSTSVGSSSSGKMRTRWLDERHTALLYTGVAALTFVTSGAMVGWSSGTFRRAEHDRTGHAGPALPNLDNWSISLAATPAIVITITACVVHRCYRWIGTKAFLLTAALLAMGSTALDAFGPFFWSTSAARILAGISAGIAFTLVPQYVDDLRSTGSERPPLDEVLAAAFPLGVLLRFAADLLPYPVDPVWNALCWGTLPACAFLGLLFLPESPRFLCATGRVPQAAEVLQRTHDPAEHHALQAALERMQLPAPGLLEAVRRQGNLTLIVPLLALFAFQAFVGALPMLFYLSDLLEMVGQQRDAERAAVLVTFVFTVSVPLSRFLQRRPLLHRPVLALSALLIAVATLGLGWYCHERRTRSPDLGDLHPDWPRYGFALLYAAYAAGLYRLPGTLLASEAADENLFALRALSTAVGWGAVYLGVRVLPPLFHTIGLGWVFWNFALVSLLAGALVMLCLPRPDDYVHKALPMASRASSTCTDSSTASSPEPASCWPCAKGPTDGSPAPGSTVVQIFNYNPPVKSTSQPTLV